MTTAQGDLALLQDPIAQELLVSRHPARLAYTWTDGTPRVVPIWFTWTGDELVCGCPPKAPKLRALDAASDVAVTIDDSTSWPYRVLLLRGTATVEMYDDVVPESPPTGTGRPPSFESLLQALTSRTPATRSSYTFAAERNMTLIHGRCMFSLGP